MCCILEGLCSDLAELFRQFFATCQARVARVTRLLIDKLAGRQHQNNQFQQQQQQERRRLESLVARPPYEYKMMSKKGLLKFVKYTLIFSNAFGFILSIFLGLFGIAYPDKHFPLSYKGREMALCSLFCMLFTTIGYCGAQNHRRILLIIYGATNVIIVIIVVILWFLFRENSILGNKEISNMFITTLAITIAVMFLFAFILAFHIRTFKDDAQDSIVSQSHQLLQQTTAFLQQQQHQLQLQQQAAAAAAGGGGHPPLGAPPHHDAHAGEQPFGMHPQQQQSHPMQQRALHQQQLPGPHHAMHQQHHMQQQQEEMMMLGHHHAPPGTGRMASMMGQQQMAPPPPPPQAIQMTHIKSTGTGGRQKSLKAPGGGAGAGQLMMQPGASTSGHQMTLMRNQSSPLPGAAGASNYQTSGRQVKGQQQQLYSQSQKHARAQQPPEPPSPPSPPPPPPQVSGSSQNHVQQQQQQQQQPPSNQQAQHHHQQHHQSMRQPPGTARMPPACPVQYCTFDCDRTV